MNIAQKYGFEEVIGQESRVVCEQEILSLLPKSIDLEITAKETKALVRRREISRAIDLLQMIFAYAVCDWSLRTVGAWCAIIGIGNLSDVGVLKRLSNSHHWLGKLVAAVLLIQQSTLAKRHLVRLRLMDGSSLSQPGSLGTDWRLHLSVDLRNNCIDGLELTDVKTGESFTNISTNPGDIRVGDRGYCHAKGIGAVLSDGGNVIVRVNWQTLHLEDEEGHHRAVLELPLPEIATMHQDYQLWLDTEKGRFGVRLIVVKLSQAAADKARNRLRRKHSKKGTPLSAKSLLGAGYVFVLTNLSSTEWTAQDILSIYRFRWQIELVIKRLKSILHLNQIRSQSVNLTQTYLLAKLLAGLMNEHWMMKVQTSIPEWFCNEKRPISIWRLTVLFFEYFANTVRGTITISMILNALPNLQRFLCEPPRARKQQLAFAQNFLNKFAPLS